MAACGSKPAADNGSSDTDASAGDDAAKKYTIGVCQLVTHDALDAATQGFIDAVQEKLGADNVDISVQNAANDQNVCTTIVNTFVSQKVDLIMANATPSLQAAYNATTEIPILGTAVTEYGVALGLKDFNGTVGGNVSGTSDLAPLTEQADMILELFPEAKTVGLLYCSAEPNSEYQVQVVEEYLTGKGITCVRYSFADSNDVAAVTTKATLSISYYDLGYKTGEMAAQILTGEADISQMAIAYAPAAKMYNPTMCEALNITVPDGYTAME